MKRVYICAGIFCVIIAVSITMVFHLKGSSQKMTQALDEVISAWSADDIDLATEKIDELSEMWKEYYIKASFIIQANKMEHISSSVAMLKASLLCQSDSFYAECENIRYTLKTLYDNQLPHLHSIF